MDFEKAYDHIDWIFLDFVLEKKGFGIGKERVRFWEDVWLGDVALCEFFPRLFQVSCKQNTTIANVCADGNSIPLSWDFGFHRNLREAEIDELSVLVSRLQCVVQISNRGDIRIWSLDSSGVFSFSPFFYL